MINKFSVYFMLFPKFCHIPRLYFVFVWSAYTLSIIPVANLWAHKITTLHDTYIRSTTYSFFRQFATKSRYMAYKYPSIASFIHAISYFDSKCEITIKMVIIWYLQSYINIQIELFEIIDLLNNAYHLCQSGWVLKELKVIKVLRCDSLGNRYFSFCLVDLIN